MKFFYVQYVYMIIAFVAGVTALFNTELYIALSGIIAPFIAWGGGVVLECEDLSMETINKK